MGGEQCPTLDILRQLLDHRASHSCSVVCCCSSSCKKMTQMQISLIGSSAFHSHLVKSPENSQPPPLPPPKPKALKAPSTLLRVQTGSSPNINKSIDRAHTLFASPGSYLCTYNIFQIHNSSKLLQAIFILCKSLEANR